MVRCPETEHKFLDRWQVLASGNSVIMPRIPDNPHPQQYSSFDSGQKKGEKDTNLKNEESKIVGHGIGGTHERRKLQNHC